MHMTDKIERIFIIPNEMAGIRLDQALAKCWPEFSRTQIQEWIKKAKITVDKRTPKARYTVLGGEEIMLNATLKSQPVFEAQAITLDIIYEDDALLIINKPAGMVVHPAAGNYSNTLLNALLQIGRASCRERV